MHLKAGSSRCLPTLWTHGLGFLREPLGNFSKLKKVRIFDMVDEDIRSIYGSIRQLKCLRSLSLHAKRGTMQNLEAISSPPLALEKLGLDGKLGKVPSWFGSLPKLTKLDLYYSELNEEGFLKLQELRHLKFLRLCRNAYVGKEMHCIGGGFPLLQHLGLHIYFKRVNWRKDPCHGFNLWRLRLVAN
ncbi:hypothetical protein AMTR_s00090p00088070 [Amborella trichopoda]|uniref:Disease resistance R13L4/SHOC-2-like LRR domain-containing protein n=1 Tax=Amborella trichopoda TaxID=13333 RepID=W1NVG4_AMBTC|nr:hypothetical protein AMTR_s00090p00088070 [Amborella trichopoda]